MKIMDSRPVWAGVALLFDNQQIFSWQLSHPEARISIEHRLTRYGAWEENLVRAVPEDAWLDITVKGMAGYWRAPDTNRGLFVPAIERGQHVLPGGDGRSIASD